MQLLRSVDQGRVEKKVDFHDFWGDLYSIFCPTNQTPSGTFHTYTMVACPWKERTLENTYLSQCSSIAEDNVIPLTATFLPSLILNELHRIPLLLTLCCFFLALTEDGAEDGSSR